jgi:hypothetical protein
MTSYNSGRFNIDAYRGSPATFRSLVPCVRIFFSALLTASGRRKIGRPRQSHGVSLALPYQSEAFVGARRELLTLEINPTKALLRTNWPKERLEPRQPNFLFHLERDYSPPTRWTLEELKQVTMDDTTWKRQGASRRLVLQPCGINES